MSRSPFRSLTVLSLALLIPLSIFGAPAQRSRNPEMLRSIEMLRESARGALEARFSPETGAFNFVRATGSAVIVRDDLTSSPTDRARRFLSEHGAVIGLSAAERADLSRPPSRFLSMAFRSGSELRVEKVQNDDIGMSHVRFSQFYQGLPVFGAEIIVHMNGRGITAVNGDFVPDIDLDPQPRLTAAEADAIALRAVSGTPHAASPRVVRNELSIYRTGLLEGGWGRNALAYGIDVAGADRQVWVDAQSGEVLNIISLRPDGLYRIVYSPEYDPDNPDLFVVRREGDPPSVLPPVNNLYDFSGHTYDLFKSTFNRDSFDNAGAIMRTVYLINNVCPNAYWNGSTTNYCPGFDIDDVVAHEWGHAYTQHTHNLIYSYQSGALNESYSDIWGEAVDLNNGVDGVGGSNNAQPYPSGQRWIVGEDLTEVVVTLLLRDMWDPERLGYPSKVSSANYYCGTGDGGGVHTNSGVPNHAFAMLVDGKTFNGQTVGAIGFTKAAHIYYRAQTTYQTRSSDFPAHADALERSCTDLTGAMLTGLYGGPNQTITSTDCAQVSKAMLAVEMRTPPTQCKYQPILAKNPPASCASSTTIFSDDFEGGLASWTTTNARTGDSPTPYYNWQIKSTLPEGRAGSAAFAFNSTSGTCAPGGDESGTYSLNSKNIVIPAGASTVQLRFDHFVATELEFDGGNVKLSVNNGGYVVVPQSKYIYNAPPSQLAGPPPVGNNTNPKAGEFAWHGADGGSTTGSWGTTVIDLSSLVKPGDSVRIQFDFGIDGCNGNQGWYVDNVRLYSCPTLSAPVLSVGSDYENPDTNGSFTLNWTRPSGATGPDTVQESTTSCSASMSDNAESGMANWNLSTTGLGMSNWTTANDKPNHSSYAFRAKALEGVLSASAIMTWKNPILVPSSGRTYLTFSDWFMNEGDDAGFVEGSVDGTNWTVLYTIARSALAPDATLAFESEPLAAKQVDLAEFGGQTIQLRFRYTVGPDNRAGSTPFGWYVDNIAINSDSWTDIATVSGTSYLVQNRSNGTYCYRVRTTYPGGPSPYSNVVTVSVNRVGGTQKADLQVTNINAGNQKGREGDKIKVTATIKNTGTAEAKPSKTEFLLDNTTVLGLVDTPTIAAGSSTDVFVMWDTRSTKGTHVIKVTADKTAVVSELNETNNSATLTVTVQGNKVSNGSFEQADASGTSPQAWSGTDTAAGTATWASGGSDGVKSAAVTGNGGSVAVNGSPTWTSQPIGVTAGEAVTLVVSVQSQGASSAPAAALDFIGLAGNVISSVNLITAPLTTNGFVKLEQATIVPKGAARVQIRLIGFAATDLATAGTVKFDSVGLY